MFIKYFIRYSALLLVLNADFFYSAIKLVVSSNINGLHCADLTWSPFAELTVTSLDMCLCWQFQSVTCFLKWVRFLTAVTYCFFFFFCLPCRRWGWVIKSLWRTLWLASCMILKAGPLILKLGARFLHHGSPHLEILTIYWW